MSRNASRIQKMALVFTVILIVLLSVMGLILLNERSSAARTSGILFLILVPFFLFLYFLIAGFSELVESSFLTSQNTKEDYSARKDIAKSINLLEFGDMS